MSLPSGMQNWNRTKACDLTVPLAETFGFAVSQADGAAIEVRGQRRKDALRAAVVRRLSFTLSGLSVSRTEQKPG